MKRKKGRKRNLKRLELEATEVEKKRDRQTIEAEKQRPHELALVKLNLESREPNQSNNYPGLRLPHFQNGKDKIDNFLRRFERMANLLKWDYSNCLVYLGSLLCGKALNFMYAYLTKYCAAMKS